MNITSILKDNLGMDETLFTIILGFLLVISFCILYCILRGIKELLIYCCGCNKKIDIEKN
jgi:hypothetical protein